MPFAFDKKFKLKHNRNLLPENLIKFVKTIRMKGVNYITDERGNKTAVVISMKNYKEEI